MNKIILLLTLALTTALILFKLDYRSFFTDELSYYYDGREIVKLNDYSENKEVPLVGKYLGGISYLIGNRNVFLLRLPFALLSIFSAFVVYLIIKQSHDEIWAVIGSVIFSWMPFIFTESRMVMLEAPLILSWLLFHLFFIKYLQKGSLKYACFSGILLGLSMGTKISSLILVIFLPVAFTILKILPNKKLTKSDFRDLIIIGSISTLTYFVLFIPQLIQDGVKSFYLHIKSIYHAYYINRDKGGKLHFINGQMYLKSPSWYYFDFINKNYNIPLKIVSLTSPFAALIQKSFYTYYWALLLVISFIFIQMIGIKQIRYITYIELPMIFLIVSTLSFTYDKSKKLGITLVFVLLSSLLTTRAAYALNETPTGYNSLYKYMAERTRNFSTDERFYVYGSIKSSRWYFFGLKDDLFVSRKEQKDWEALQKDMPTFKYIIFDKIELAKKPDNSFFKYITENKLEYNKITLDEFFVYILK